MEKYEYAIDKTYPLQATENQLNVMGNDGWELTGCLKVKEFNHITETYYYYFKRLLTPNKQ